MFLGGCLSGAALLSLTSERASDVPPLVTVTPPPSPPGDSDPADLDEDDELGDEEGAEPDVTSRHATTSRTGDADPAELDESEHGPSAADVLSALEQAYQRQVAAAEEAAMVRAEPAVAEAADVEAEVVPPAAVPAAPAPMPDERVAKIEPEPEPVEVRPHTEPVEVAAAADQNQPAVQQIVVYQPVYMLPPADPAVPTGTPARRRSVGRDPWAPLTISPRHNPWGTAAGGGAWATVGVAGGVWAGGFVARP